MKIFGLSGAFFKTRFGRSPLRHSYESLTEFFSADNPEEKRRRAFLCIVHSLLSRNGVVSGERIEAVRRLIESKKGSEEAFRQIRALKEATDIAPQKAAEALEGLDEEEIRKLLHFLVLLTLSSNAFDEAGQNYLAELSSSLGVSPEVFDDIIKSARNERAVQDRLIRSGAGLVAAIGVIVLFILTATLLRSVIFGLIGAYLLLPLEKYFEKKIRGGKGFIARFVRGCEICVQPLYKLSQAVRRPAVGDKTPADCEKMRDKKIVKQAVSLTVFLAGFFVIAGIIFLSSVTGKYVVELKDAVKKGSQKVTVQQTADGKPVTWSGRVENKFDELTDKFQNSPTIRKGVEMLRKTFADEKTRKELAGVVLRATGGVVNFTAGVLGTLVSIVSDVILSLFFGLLFLFKLAEFCRTDSSSGRQSEYLIRTVFNGKWLPHANENTIAGARTILSGTFMRLRIWVRGYLLLMLIDATVYTTAFFFLKVPYFPILGVVAGCGILLPYIGPIAGCLLAVCVTLASGGGAGQILGLLLFYAVYSGIVEQFILYPAVIGESLGLTTLETIIVVLLGAVFAGISGMILALPAASVIKFIVPKIYNYWGGVRILEDK
ncbi:MAG: AI-2E family transporter [Lentisphaerae bacterium]|nr:AI-2E family transporter [Lentisphaerota bacterium]